MKTFLKSLKLILGSSILLVISSCYVAVNFTDLAPVVEEVVEEQIALSKVMDFVPSSNQGQRTNSGYIVSSSTNYMKYKQKVKTTSGYTVTNGVQIELAELGEK